MLQLGKELGMLLASRRKLLLCEKKGVLDPSLTDELD
jgi:hypothetical protein